MNDMPRQKLIEIVTHRQSVTNRTGRDVVSDAKLCGALLRDLCGEHKREISVLVAAVEERVPNDLQSGQANTPLDVLLARLTKRLVDDRALAEDAARWAVESWTLALGLKLPQPTVAAPTAPTVSPKPVPPAASTTPTFRPPTLFVSNTPYVFACTWKVEVMGRPSGNTQAEWKKIGETPDNVTVPAGHEIGLRPHGVGGEALAIWISELQDPAAIQWLDLGLNEVNDAELVLLRVFTNLTRLDIANLNITKVTAQNLAHLSAFPKLTHLRLKISHTLLGDSAAVLVHLKNLTALTDLDLQATGVSDKDLEHLKTLSNLTSLNLSKTRVVGEGLAFLQGLTSLVSLDLAETQATDTGLTSLKTLTTLMNLNLNECKITDAGLAHLRTLTRLTSLSLKSTNITDAGLCHLCGLTNLTDLNLGWCKIAGAGLVHLRGLTNLMSLNFNKCKITDAGLVHLRALTNLKNLELGWCEITDAGLVHLRVLPNLKNLNVLSCHKITRQGTEALQRPGLKFEGTPWV